jgi:hypothetical protein
MQVPRTNAIYTMQYGAGVSKTPCTPNSFMSLNDFTRIPLFRAF